MAVAVGLVVWLLSISFGTADADAVSNPPHAHSLDRWQQSNEDRKHTENLTRK